LNSANFTSSQKIYIIEELSEEQYLNKLKEKEIIPLNIVVKMMKKIS